MVTKDQIKKAVDNLPNNLLNEVYSYLRTISANNKKELSEEESRKKWDTWWENLKNFTPDFMNERIQPPLETREKMFD